jgi:hypothetical protein
MPTRSVGMLVDSSLLRICIVSVSSMPTLRVGMAPRKPLTAPG